MDTCFCRCCWLNVEAYHIEHENIDQFVMLNMFRGSTMDALKHAADIGQLNDHMMALAPSGKNY